MPAAELNRLAHEHELAGRLDEAERLLCQILAAVPQHAPSLHLLGVVAYRRGRNEEALALIESAIACGIDTPLYFRNIGELYRSLGRYEEAETSARRGVRLNPASPVALLNLGVILADRRKLDAAIDCFEQVLALDPSFAAAHFGLAEALLTRGEFERGWDEYEWRFRIPDATPPMPDTDRPQWDGAPFADGTLLLVADQGLGDGIQFARFIPWAAQRCPDIALACTPVLRPVLAPIRAGMRLVTEWQERGEFAAWCPLSSLPRLAGTRLETIPAPIRYLRSDAARRARWSARLNELVPRGLRRVGLVWAGQPLHKNDRKRSTSLRALAEVMELEGIALIVLQKGATQQEVGRGYGRAPLVHVSAEIADLEDTMAILDEIDVVLTVDTSVAHLAGAMGRPTMLMLPWAAEWRWLERRCDSPWYPTVRLFRQPSPDNWADVGCEVARCLETVKQGSLASQRFTC